MPAVAAALRGDLVKAVAADFDDIVCEVRDDGRCKSFFFRAVKRR